MEEFEPSHSHRHPHVRTTTTKNQESWLRQMAQNGRAKCVWILISQWKQLPNVISKWWSRSPRCSPGRHLQWTNRIYKAQTRLNSSSSLELSQGCSFGTCNILASKKPSRKVPLWKLQHNSNTKRREEQRIHDTFPYWIWSLLSQLFMNSHLPFLFLFYQPLALCTVVCTECNVAWD